MTATAYAQDWQLGENILSVCFSRDGSVAAASLVDGTVLLIKDGAEQRVAAHPAGSSLAFCRDVGADGFLSAGDDGRVVRLRWDCTPEILAEQKGAWIDSLAAHENGTIAYSTGRMVFILGRSEPLPHPSTVGGIDIHPNGKRLAATHYNGVSLWWLNAKESKPQTLIWKGSHLRCLWHPSGDYIMTSMQENALHGWRMKDLGELRMAGYPGKIHSFDFSQKGKWLVTSGADQIICWPFTGSGPQGKPPMALGVPEGKPVSVVAPHPKDDMTVAGYASGRVVLALFEDRLPIELMPPDNIPVTAIAWSPDGLQLLSAQENGHLCHFTSKSIIAASEAAYSSNGF